jgi:anti-sigma28 factor (negative regulator of flagellin synthesis)
MIESAISPIFKPPAQRAGESERGSQTRTSPAEPLTADRVELSDAARAHLAGERSEPIRQGMVNRVRAEIGAGTYLSDEKLDVAVDRLLDALRP